MILESERIYLRSWNLDDAEVLFSYAQNPKIGPMAGWAPHKSVNESIFFIEHILSSWGFFAIILKENDQLIGSINVLIGEASNFSIGSNDGELGFWIAEPFWRQGYITEAIELILDFCFYDLELTNVWCGAFDDNIPSRKLQEKLGFEYQYTLQNVHTMNGEIKTELVNCMDKELYEELYE